MDYSDPQSPSSRRWQTANAPVSKPGNRYIDFLMPGLIGLNFMGGGLFGVGFALVDMRVRKLLKRLLATPMRRGDFMLSIFSCRAGHVVARDGAAAAVGLFGFGVPVCGNPLLLLVIILVGSIAFAGIGLLLASRTAKTETISGLINLVMLPGWLLSGTFFSAKRFPDAVQPLIQALPLTQLNDALREVMLEGASLRQVACVGILFAWGAVPFLLARRGFAGSDTALSQLDGFSATFFANLSDSALTLTHRTFTLCRMGAGRFSPCQREGGATWPRLRPALIASLSLTMTPSIDGFSSRCLWPRATTFAWLPTVPKRSPSSPLVIPI